MTDKDRIAELENALKETIDAWDELGDSAHNPILAQKWLADSFRHVMDNNRKVMKGK